MRTSSSGGVTLPQATARFARFAAGTGQAFAFQRGFEAPMISHVAGHLNPRASGEPELKKRDESDEQDGGEREQERVNALAGAPHAGNHQRYHAEAEEV